jgi:hypothetical protein
MVRQDKITYLITFFQNNSDVNPNDAPLHLWLTDYYSTKNLSQIISNADVFSGNVVNNRVLGRLGVVTTSDIKMTETLMSEFIPFTKHKLLFVNIQKLGQEICTAFNPTCRGCRLNVICDFYNQKNQWAA